MTNYILEMRKALRSILGEDRHTLLLGQDIEDPYGGNYKVTRGLSTLFPNRVINMPISEAAMMGYAIGLSMKGYKPIVEYMFYDFMTLAVDQIINHALKVKELWGLDTQILLRTLIGKPRRDGGDATHSQDMTPLLKNYIPVDYLRDYPVDMVHELVPKLFHTSGVKLLVEDYKLYMNENR